MWTNTSRNESIFKKRRLEALDSRPAHIILSFVYWFPVLWLLCMAGNLLIILILRRSLKPRKAIGLISSSDDADKKLTSLQKDAAAGAAGAGDNQPTSSTPLSPSYTGKSPGDSIRLRSNTNAKQQLLHPLSNLPKAGTSINSATLCLIAISAVDMCSMTFGALWMYLLFIQKQRGVPFILCYAIEHVTSQFSTWAEAYLSMTRCIAIIVPHRSKVLISTRNTMLALSAFAVVIGLTEGPVYVARVVMLCSHGPAAHGMLEKAWFVKWETVMDAALRYLLPLIVSLVSSAVIVTALLRRGSRFSLLSGRVITKKSKNSTTGNANRPWRVLLSVWMRKAAVAKGESSKELASVPGLPITVSIATGKTPSEIIHRKVTTNQNSVNLSVHRRCKSISIMHIMVVLLGKNLFFFFTSIPCLVFDCIIVFLGNNVNHGNNSTGGMTAEEAQFVNAKNWFFVFHLFSFCDLSFSFFIYLLASHRFRNVTVQLITPVLARLLRCLPGRSGS